MEAHTAPREEALNDKGGEGHCSYGVSFDSYMTMN